MSYQSNQEKRSELIRRANGLLENKPFTKENKAQFDSFMTLADALQHAPEVITTDEKRQATKYFRDLMLGPEVRTYTPLSTSADSQLIAQGFERDIKTLMIADGPLFAGSPLLTNINVQKNGMSPSKQPVSDDLSSTGFVLVENSGPASDEAELNFSSVLFGSTTFSSGIILVSSSLSEDLEAWTTTETLVKRTASARLSRIMNATWLAALKTALALNTSASIHGGAANVTASNVYSLIASVGAAYRPSAAFIMSSVQQAAIGALITAGSSAREFPDVLSAKPKIRGYDVHVIAAAAASDILFGDFSFAYAKSDAIEIQTMSERFILDGYLGLVIRQRADFKWSVATTSDSPVKTLLFP